MSYSIRIKKSAVEELARIPSNDRVRVIRAIDHLKDHPHSGGSLKGEYRGIRRIRVGDYRVLYEVSDEDLIILVIRVATREEAYRGR